MGKEDIVLEEQNFENPNKFIIYFQFTSQQYWQLLVYFLNVDRFLFCLSYTIT